jgi:uncharacterized protein YutE (UPF0331/DUF86 family)
MEDIQSVLAMSDDKIVQDHHIVKSLKFSTIVMAESIGNILQHFLAKNKHVAVHGFTDTFVKAGEHEIMARDLLNRLLPFARFRNMLVHQYRRVEDGMFIKNSTFGIKLLQQITSHNVLFYIINML